ncbi:APC5 protein [Coemansia brasiliensis]|uniref:Anaphase-promoting complex subunit 5 n=1 Tax=Coemansia brasiliensis TaxID=2650707 RepID=A0A9W8IF03_9FUNG|nr:APC5 protein [Coemansia brasiliensis]
MSSATYLSAAKFVLLVGIDQYARHSDWGPQTLSAMAGFLAGRLSAPSWAEPWRDIAQALDGIDIPIEQCTLLAALTGHMRAQLVSIDALHAFFDGLDTLLADEPPVAEDALLLDSDSLFGVFVRRCLLAFAQLEFHRVGAFLCECQSALSRLEERAPAAPAMARMEMHEHIEHLIAALEDGVGASVPDVERQIRMCAAQLSDSSRLQFLRFLHLVRQGESHEAESALRRFFDSSYPRAVHQHALLYLAAMRVQLGMLDAARLALDEATHIARDCQDHHCLLFISCWHARLLVARFKHARLPSHMHAARSALSTLIDKAAHMRCSELQIVGYLLLSDLQLAASDGDGDCDRVFENLVRAQALAIEHNVPKQLSACRLALAQAWLRFGCPWVSQLYAQLPLPRATENEHAQKLRLLMSCQHRLCGYAPLPDCQFANPALSDHLFDASSSGL